MPYSPKDLWRQLARLSDWFDNLPDLQQSVARYMQEKRRRILSQTDLPDTGQVLLQAHPSDIKLLIDSLLRMILMSFNLVHGLTMHIEQVADAFDTTRAQISRSLSPPLASPGLDEPSQQRSSSSGPLPTPGVQKRYPERLGRLQPPAQPALANTRAKQPKATLLTPRKQPKLLGKLLSSGKMDRLELDQMQTLEDHFLSFGSLASFFQRLAKIGCGRDEDQEHQEAFLALIWQLLSKLETAESNDAISGRQPANFWRLFFPIQETDFLSAFPIQSVQPTIEMEDSEI